jgi:Tfp pilus assembly protein PilX
MFNQKLNSKKGVVLYIVLCVLLTVVVLANIILHIISSQSRMTRHQVSRIQAYYASLAGMNLAVEKLKAGDWAPDPTQSYIYTLCKTGCTINDPDIHYKVSIRIDPANSSGVRSLNITANYTYTP